MTLETVADVDLIETVTTIDLNVKIEEILILKLSLKSTLPESIEIKVKKTSRSISLNSERLRISL